MNLIFNLLSDNSGGLGPPVNTTPDTDSTNIGLGLLILFLIVAVILFLIFMGLYIELKNEIKNNKSNTEKSKIKNINSQPNNLSLKDENKDLTADESKMLTLYKQIGERFGEQAQHDYITVGENLLKLGKK